MSRNQHDELAQLFATNMQLSPGAAIALQQQQQDREPAVAAMSPILEQKSASQVHYISSPVHFISSHYTGTAHVCGETLSEPSRSPPPPYQEVVMPEAMVQTLRQNSIDPYALLPNQIQLFLNADYEQRLRLLELWRIAPPSFPLEAHLQSRHYGTSVEQEEQAAMIRYEQQMQARSMQPEECMLDAPIVDYTAPRHVPEPITPIRGPGEDAWPPAARMRASSIAAGIGSVKADAEPYMVSGYRSDQVRQHSADPAYGANLQLWEAPAYAHARPQESSTADYGTSAQIRNHADWERMNERIMRERSAVVQGHVDDDMIM